MCQNVKEHRDKFIEDKSKYDKFAEVLKDRLENHPNDTVEEVEDYRRAYSSLCTSRDDYASLLVEMLHDRLKEDNTFDANVKADNISFEVNHISKVLESILNDLTDLEGNDDE